METNNPAPGCGTTIDYKYLAQGYDMATKTLPAQVIVKPRRGALNPNDEDDDREMCTGHIISTDGYIFRESGTSQLFYEYEEPVRAWLTENGYQRISNLKHDYLGVSGLHGNWSREK